MARRTKEEAQATREDILDAAQACFHEYGVAGTSLAMIGTRAGYTRGAVYWHFRNKIEVLEADIRTREKAARDLEAEAAEIDAAVFDLKAVNPNAVTTADARTPEEILVSIQEQGRILADALTRLKALLATLYPCLTTTG